MPADKVPILRLRFANVSISVPRAVRYLDRSYLVMSRCSDYRLLFGLPACICISDSPACQSTGWQVGGAGNG